MKEISSITKNFYCLVYESFEDYIRVETMDGENKYDAGEYGLQVKI